MHILPMKRLIIIYGKHLDRISVRTTPEDRLINILKEKGFEITDDLKNLGITVYRNSEYSNQNLVTHVVINFGNLVSEIHYYTLNELVEI